MTLISRLFVPLALLASILPSVIAGDFDCKPDEFWYENKSCCVPKTPPSNPSKPPPGKSCPQNNYYWSDDKSCCLPVSPPPSKPPPTCKDGHWWKDSESCCSPPSDCKDDEFWYPSESCCLPYGGPPNPPSPPTGSGCPSSGWYWYGDQSCCVPHQPNPPPPKCPSEWEWTKNKCQPKSTPPSPKYPQPSHRYDHGWKRAQDKA